MEKALLECGQRLFYPFRRGVVALAWSPDCADSGGFARVANQQRIDPMQTMAAPCQNDSDSGVRNSTAARAADSTGMKYEAPARTVTLPCRMPTFHAA